MTQVDGLRAVAHALSLLGRSRSPDTTRGVGVEKYVAGMMGRVIATGVALAVMGCAMTPQVFERRRAAMTNYEVCSSWIDAEKARDWQFLQATKDEAGTRGLDAQGCADLVVAERKKAAAVIGGLLLVGAIAAAAKGGGGGYRAPVPAYNVADTQWDWDYMNGGNGFPIWVCRGVQTGQFAEEAKCAGRLMNDGRWPGLGDPFRR